MTADIMDLVRRSGAPSAFAWLLGISLGAACTAMTACSATSGSQGGGGWGQSGGGPLGTGDPNVASGSSSGASSSSGGASTTAPGGGSSSGNASSNTPLPEASAGEAASSSHDAGDAGAAAEAGVVPPDFSLIDTTVTTLIDGATVPGFDPIAEGATINLAVAGSALSIRANTLPAIVGSVAFALDASYTHTENTIPYTLCSDNGTGTITSCASILTVGKHTLSATPYTGAGLTGTAGPAVIVDFTIVDAADAGGQ
ncbi:MAG TPA: hypothetical protein VIF09_24015 [Polyangiaceae bacterium]